MTRRPPRIPTSGRNKVRFLSFHVRFARTPGASAGASPGGAGIGPTGLLAARQARRMMMLSRIQHTMIVTSSARPITLVAGVSVPWSVITGGGSDAWAISSMTAYVAQKISPSSTSSGNSSASKSANPRPQSRPPEWRIWEMATTPQIVTPIGAVAAIRINGERRRSKGVVAMIMCVLKRWSVVVSRSARCRPIQPR